MSDRFSLRSLILSRTGMTGSRLNLFCAVFLMVCCAGSQAQTSHSLDTPQTRLAPIGPAVSSGLSGGLPATPPYGSSGAFGGPGFNAPLPSATPSGSFDPYAGGPASGFANPVPYSGGLLGAGAYGAIPSPGPSSGGTVFGAPANQAPPLLGSTGGLFGSGSVLGSPVAVPPGGYAGPVFGSPGPYAAPSSSVYPDAAYPGAAPSTLFPGGLFGSTSSNFVPQFDPYRLIQRVRFRHAFLHGNDDPDDLEINDTDVAFAFAFPRIFASTQPLFVTPSFSFHQWDGPDGSGHPGITADLPANAYSAFLDFGWRSDPARIVGAELAVSVGVFSEFDVLRSDSLRVRGKGLGTFHLTPASTLKLGVYYYDRVNVKLLPAGGLFWRPNPFTRVDLFFPQPKISRFLSTVGTQDVWWYLSADYGGGSWTIDRDNGESDQVDINDIRLMLGFEWGLSERMQAGLRTAFFEFGYVADRELVYRYHPGDDLKLDDTWMVRLGLGY